MKTIIVCALAVVALAALVHGEDGYNFGLPLGLNSPRFVEFLSRTRRDDRVCEPGSTKMIECENYCICSNDGSAWGCTQRGCETFQLTISDMADPSPKA